MLQFNGGSMLKGLLMLLITPPHIPHRYHNTCSRMLENFHEFGSSGWSNLPEAEVTSELVGTICTGRLAQTVNVRHNLRMLCITNKKYISY
jgi:hypothetical protein